MKPEIVVSTFPSVTDGIGNRSQSRRPLPYFIDPAWVTVFCNQISQDDQICNKGSRGAADSEPCNFYVAVHNGQCDLALAVSQRTGNPDRARLNVVQVKVAGDLNLAIGYGCAELG